MQLVDEATGRPSGSRRSRLTITAFAFAGTLVLGTGAAIAAPFVADWWMWVPNKDLTTESEPFERDGAMITCTTTIRVVIDGGTATDQSASRLQKARDFLGRTDLDDYEDDATQMLGQADGDMWQHLSPELAHDATLAMAIALDMRERGLTGQGVAIETHADCPEAE